MRKVYFKIKLLNKISPETIPYYLRLQARVFNKIMCLFETGVQPNSILMSLRLACECSQGNQQVIRI